ncbi:MAG TPA: hypothetical protein VH115_07345 [Solirubrobacteraceae bacterium]|nr:hypothetical protein [Solirubrobacteraceae bacterium]
MTHLSRPLQVALAAAGLLVVVWFVALRGNSSSSEPTATTSSHAASSSSSGGSSGGSSAGSGGVYHGSAPGVEGLTRDIQKARGAAAQSGQNAAQLQQKAAQASGEGNASKTGGTASSAASATHSSSASAVTKAPATTRPSTTTHKSTHAANATSGQTWVEHELGHKVTVALLFYTPRSYDDSRTRRELERLIGEERGSHTKLALRVAAANQVGTYGAFTRVASVYQTPTLLIVTPTGEVKPQITGLTDAFAIEQEIDEKTQP